MKEIERDNAASTCVAWTTTAMRLMNEAPDPGEIVQIFRYRLHRSGWSGSLADILTRRVPLLEYLTNDPNQRIAWPTITPDGKSVLYSRTAGADTRTGNSDLYIASTTVANQEQRLAKVDGDNYPFAAGARNR